MINTDYKSEKSFQMSVSFIKFRVVYFKQFIVDLYQHIYLFYEQNNSFLGILFLFC